MKVQHTYRIRHNGVESTPHSLAELRQMWQSGQIDNTTEFKRGDSPVWLDANDLWAELQLPSGVQTANHASAIQPGALRPGAVNNLAPSAPAHVRIVSARLPFREVFVLVFKFYAAAILLALLAAAAWLALGRFLP